MKFYLIILNIVFLSIQVSGQASINQKNIDNEKTGLWIEVNNNSDILKITDFTNGVRDGFSMSFSPHGEILGDTFYQNGIFQNVRGLFTDSTKFDSTINKHDKVKFGATTWLGKLDKVNYKNGYPHGIQTVHWNKYRKKQVHINYFGTLVYIINYDTKLKPVTYYSFVGINRTYGIVKCTVKNNILNIKYINTNSNQVNVPSLKSRTLMHIRGKGKLFHELYSIRRDTLIVNLNHNHPEGRYFTFGIQKSKKKFVRKQTNMANQKFIETLIMPEQYFNEKVQVYLHDAYIEWIVLIIEDKRYLFRNYDWFQNDIIMIN
jgi:hypothetical protein